MAAKAAPVDSRSLLGTLTQLNELLQAFPAATDVPSDLQRVTGMVRDLLGVDLVSLVDTSDAPPRVVAASPPELLEAAHAVDGIGVAVAASRSGREVRCPDLASVPGTGGAETASAPPLQAVAALPLVARGRLLGALSLHMRTVHHWTEDEIALGRLAAGLIALHLANAAAVHDQTVLAGQLQTALDSRVVIEQAKGVLAASEGVSVDEAFTRLRSHARRTNAKLADVASDVVAGGPFPPG